MSNFIETTNRDLQWQVVFAVYQVKYPAASKRRRVVNKWRNQFFRTKGRRYPESFGHVLTEFNQGLNVALSELDRIVNP